MVLLGLDLKLGRFRYARLTVDTLKFNPRWHPTTHPILVSINNPPYLDGVSERRRSNHWACWYAAMSDVTPFSVPQSNFSSLLTPHVLTVILRRSWGNRRLSPLSISFSLISGLLSSSFIALHSLHYLSISSFLYFELCEQHWPPFFLFTNSYSIIQAVWNVLLLEKSSLQRCGVHPPSVHGRKSFPWCSDPSRWF